MSSMPKVLCARRYSPFGMIGLFSCGGFGAGRVDEKLCGKVVRGRNEPVDEERCLRFSEPEPRRDDVAVAAAVAVVVVAVAVAVVVVVVAVDAVGDCELLSYRSAVC